MNFTIEQEITVENFDYSNLKKWIKGFSHKDKVEIAVYSAELVIDLYDGVSDAPKVAIQAAKDWLLNPIKENKDKCISAAYAAADVAAYATADAAATAAYAYAADDAAAATATAAASAHNSLEIKGKIVDFILILIDKEKQESKQSEIDSAAQQVESLSKESECNDEGEIEWRSGDKCSYKGYEGLVIGWHPEQPVIVIETSEHGVICVAMSLLSKPLTPEQKQQQIDERNGKKFYDIQHDIAPVDIWSAVDVEDRHYWIEFAKKVSFEGKVESI